MGKLEDLRSELYDPDGTKNPTPPFFGKPKGPSEDVRREWEEETMQAETSSPTPPASRFTMSKFHWAAVSMLCVGIASIGAVFLFGFQKEPLEVTLLAKERAEAGEKVTYRIVYKNVGRDTLKDVELSFTYPPGALPLRGDAEAGKIPRTRIVLSDVPKGHEGVVELEARIFGQENESKKAEVVMLYRPEASTSRFVAKAVAETVIVRVPLVLTMNIPTELVSGQIATIVVDYASNAESVFMDMFFGITYPQGFIPMSFDPKPMYENSIWSLGEIRPGDSGTITITGKLSGAPSEVKTFAARLGLYDMLLKEWMPHQTASVGVQLSTPLLSIEERINEGRDPAVKAGDELHVRLHYKNTLDVPLENILVEAELLARSGEAPIDPERVLDFKNLNIEKGVYSQTTKKIVWSPASNSQLSAIPPHGEGDLSFSIRLNSLLGIDSDLSNLVIESRAEIRPSRVPSGFEGVELTSRDSVTARVMAHPVLSSLALYRNQYLPNSGPLPPKVSAKTTYVVFWQLANSLGEFTDVEVRGKLSPDISWENRHAPEGSALSHDPASGNISWRVGRLSAEAGRSKPAPLVAFQIGLTPGLNQVGRTPLFISNVEVHGRDAFTGEEVRFGAADLTAELQGDPTTTSSDWRVVP